MTDGAETKRETERKYEAPEGTAVPDLTTVRGVAAVRDEGVTELDAVYHDTPDLRLAADSLTLRRRTGGEDAGWHLKFPVASGIRDEIRAPLSDSLPGALAGLLRSRVRDRTVVPVVRLRTSRHVRRLTAEDGTPLAELSVDTVHAEHLPTGARTSWTEIEVELADDADETVLDAVGRHLKKAGIHPSKAPSKLARALEDTGARPAGGQAAAPAPCPAGTAGHAVLAYVREQADALVALDPAVRRDLPDAVHRMRVASRRLRSALKTYRKVLDRTVTDPLGDELKWLAGELGRARDLEVLEARLHAALDALPPEQTIGPVRARLRTWRAARDREARRHVLDALDSDRHLALLGRLDALLADPPLLPGAKKKAAEVLPKAIRRDHRRLSHRIDRALALDPGHERDLALHEARKAAKRARYAGDAAVPTLGKPARRYAKRVKAVQTCLGEHQDAVVARGALLDLADEAHAAGETAFTWGVLHAREGAAAQARQQELPALWRRASARRIRAALGR
ncbi:CYTH and CHAD domain-containing protein [Streptomyces roseicoloratus]|uniref:CYTH and CHAD domain-containing protein n=1 Tax=Streptomyces roseicoloratus TaxID=2508722 RepID=UPI001009C9BA|nr:CYTH and CHAD domain-containing protein [Streptomyces roseicoloratus]